MADQQQLKRLRAGVEGWNHWRGENPTVHIDLSSKLFNTTNLSSVDLGKANLRGANLRGADLSKANLSDADLSKANLSDANLYDVDLRGANLKGASLMVNRDHRANLRGATINHATQLTSRVRLIHDIVNNGGAEQDFRGANIALSNLSGANLSKADLSGAEIWASDLSEADLSNANLSNADLNSTNLSNANLSSANLSNANLSNADLNSTNLSNANLSSANLSDANLRGADLSKVNLRGINLRGADLSKVNLRGAILSRPDPRKATRNREETDGVTDLSEADLRGADLRGADLRGANLRGANLGGADLRGADLRDTDLTSVTTKNDDYRLDTKISRFTDLRGAKLSGAKLRGSTISDETQLDAKWRLVHSIVNGGGVGQDLSETDLSETDLSEADLSGANLSGANLSGANFYKVQVLGTNFSQALFTGACLQDWNANRNTNLKEAQADYIYLNFSEEIGLEKPEFTDRRPHSGEFKPDEFATLFQQTFNTLDLIFVDGIDWQAFFASFQELRQQYNDADLNIQAIEKKSGSSFVVRLEVPEDTDHAAIEQTAKVAYEQQLQLIEARYQAQLQAKDAEITEVEIESHRWEIETIRQQNTRIDRIVELLAEREQLKVPLHPNQLKILHAINDGIESCYEMSDVTGLTHHQVEYYIESLGNDSYLTFQPSFDGYICRLTSKGHVATDDLSLLLSPSSDKPNMNITNNNQGATIGNFANHLNDNASQNYTAEQRQTLAESAQEIQILLDQLSQTYPTETLTQKAQFAEAAAAQAQTNKPLTQRILSALDAGTMGAIAELLNHPAAAFFIEAVKDWKQTQP